MAINRIGIIVLLVYAVIPERISCNTSQVTFVNEYVQKDDNLMIR